MITLLCMMAFSLASVYFTESAYSRILVRESINSVMELLANQINHDATLLESLAGSMISGEEALREAWLTVDREALLNKARPFFTAMGWKYNITYFYFIDLKGICFLRVHDPANFGDAINRFTLKEAMATGSSSFGMEVGAFSALTLREVYPWYINNKLEGYIEIGEEINHITPELKRVLGVELIFMIDKNFIDKEKWEKRIKAASKASDWGRFKDFIVVDNTVEGDAVPAFEAYLKRSHREHSETVFKVTMMGRTYRGGFVPIVDAGSRDIGDVVVLKDVTQHERSLRYLFIVIVFAYAIISGIVFFILRALSPHDFSRFLP